MCALPKQKYQRLKVYRIFLINFYIFMELLSLLLLLVVAFAGLLV